MLERLFGPRARLKACVFAGLAASSTVLLSAVTSGVQAAAPGSPARISWFYKPPNDGSSLEQIAGRSAEVILTGRNDLSYRDRLRGAGWTGRRWVYVEQPVTAAPLDGPCGTFNVWWDLWDNQVAWEHQVGVAGSNDFCKYIHPNESWMLHKPSDGSRITRRYGNQTQYYMNAGSPGWREWFAARVKRDTQNWGYDGVFLDDLWHNPAQHGGFKEYPSAAAYQQAVIEFLRHLKSRLPGIRVVANTEVPELYSPALDGWMYEAFGGWWSNRYQPEQDVLGLWQLAERDAQAGKDIFLIAQGDRNDTRKLRFSYAAYLMVAHERVSFRYSHTSSYQQSWEYPEYRLPLGQPRGGRYNVGGSTWRRDFEGGAVLVNLSAGAQQAVDLRGTFTAQDGGTVTSVTLAPQTGVLLLGTPPASAGGGTTTGSSTPKPPATPAPAPKPKPTQPAPKPKSSPPAPKPSSTPASKPNATPNAPAPIAAASSTSEQASSVSKPRVTLAPRKTRRRAARDLAKVGAPLTAPQLAQRLRQRGVDVERYLRQRPGVRAKLKLVGVRWDGETFYTRAALRRWLRVRGASYTVWARTHPTAAKRLVR